MQLYLSLVSFLSLLLSHPGVKEQLPKFWPTAHGNVMM